MGRLLVCILGILLWGILSISLCFIFLETLEIFVNGGLLLKTLVVSILNCHTLFRGGIRRFVTPRDAENNKAIMRAENTYYSISNTVAVYPHSLVK